MTAARTAQGAARIAGFGYLALFVLAILAHFFVLAPLGVRGDAAATAANIAASEPAYRAASDDVATPADIGPRNLTGRTQSLPDLDRE